MPLKVTTSDGKTHEVAEDVSLAALQRRTGWVNVEAKEGSVARVRMSQVVKIEETPDRIARPMRIDRPQGRIDTPRR
jgi:hypothetical protein